MQRPKLFWNFWKFSTFVENIKESKIDLTSSDCVLGLCRTKDRKNKKKKKKKIEQKMFRYKTSHKNLSSFGQFFIVPN
jgi:hypothetical protein